MSLLGALRASPDAFISYIGKDRASAIVDKITSLLTNEERSLFDRELPQFSLGARLDPPPSTLKPTQYDIGERDRMFARIQALRTFPSRSAEEQSELLRLEGDLRDMLNSGAGKSGN
jgi:hypothetical protein